MRPNSASGTQMKKLKPKSVKLKHDISASTGVNTNALDQTKSPKKLKGDIFERATDEEEDTEYINDISIINSSSIRLDKQINKILREKSSRLSQKSKKGEHQ